jgi:hypothetical protein
MPSEKQIVEMTKSLQGSGKTFAEFLSELFTGQFLEIYVGDAYEDVSTEQISTTYPSVFCGKVVSAYRECLIISCVYGKSHLQMGNFLFINERAIRAVNVVNEKGTLESMMMRSKETLEVQRMFGDK